jgi:hypothetical protein
MLLFGKLLDPQPPSDVAVAPGVEHTITGGHGARPSSRSWHNASHARNTAIIILAAEECWSHHLPRHGAALVHFSAGAVWQLAQPQPRAPGDPVHLDRRHAVPHGQRPPRHFQADWGFLLDPLSSVMILVVTGIGFLIHVYSTGYMAHDNGYYRFFGYLNLFVFFMLMLVLANNYTLLFVGWEGVGLCSYLLIGFYFHKKSAATRARRRSSSTAWATPASCWACC